MLDVTWKLFSQTGNIEAYLLLKELEDDPLEKGFGKSENDTVNSFDTEM